MSDMVDMYRDVRAMRKARRDKFGVPCPRCKEKRPKAEPSILLPNQACKVDGYLDPRTERLTDEQLNECYREAGLNITVESRL